MADSRFHILSLCSGTGMLDEGVCCAIPDARIVGYVEREAFAAALLLARMGEACLEPAPIWCSRLEEFESCKWSGIVDCLTAGFPCQPWSTAGNQRGIEDERWIWPTIAAIISTIQPPVLFLENVPGLLSGRGLNRVLGDIAALGFDAEWCHLAAADVGASHHRERLFILAIDASRGCGVLRQSSERFERLVDWPSPTLADTDDSTRSSERGKQSSQWTHEFGGGNDALADADRGQLSLAWREPVRRDGAGSRDAILADTDRGQREQLWRPIEESRRCLHGFDSGGEYLAEPSSMLGRTEQWSQSHGVLSDLADGNGARLERQHSPMLVPKPSGPGQRAEIFAPGPRDERWSELLADEPWLAPAIESGVCGLVDGHAVVLDESRTDQLRAIGNAVVALQAAVAFRVLSSRLLRSFRPGAF